ncbi:MAG: DUF3341 domain-containing protein [Candidatus Hinthialibacter antarcticus]|nr:DUF3341 domain-containing protein [Candidatus Hinthialibacter antarcticus]
MSDEKKLYGFLVEFEEVDDLRSAAEKVRDAGYTQWDCHSPFPIHGMDGAMGIKPTILPWFVLCAGIIGATVGLLMQWYMNAVDYPIIISGKPMFSLPANIPIIFELTILLSALTAVGGLFALNGLPMHYHPLFSNERFLRATNDRFFLVIEARDPKFNLEQTRQLLDSFGGAAVETVED